jgi:type II secretory ATPase GspE/PulE/Tfp pilus assembly ATPase PilB-like protein
MESLVKEGSIGSVLYKSRIITEDDIRSALEEQRVSGCRFGEALVRLGIVTQEDIDWALSNQLDIPYVRLSEEIIDRSAIGLVPADLARKYSLIPIIRTGDELHIALVDPLNRAAVEEVEQLTGCRVTVSIPIIRELREMLDLFYGPARASESFGFVSAAFTEAILERINADMGGGLLLDYLVLFFIRNGISSLSFQPAGTEVRVSARRGELFREVGRFPAASYPDMLLHLRKLSRIKGSRDIAAEGSVLFRYRESDVEFNVFLVKALGGECVTLKMRCAAPFPAGIAELGLPREQEEAFRSLGAPGSGLLLFASWNRAERSRFMDLLLDEMDAGAGNVLLLGEGIGKGKRVFPRIPLLDGSPEELEMLLTALVDHDPDTIALEDATDSRSLHTAWKAAMRGSLVVGGISCNGLGGALDYLVSARYANRSIATGIRGVVAFTTVRTLCPQCRESSPASAEDAGLPAAGSYCRAPGCAACGYSGFGGKRYLVDVLPFDREFREAFASARNGAEIMRRLAEDGYRSNSEELAELLRLGEISPEEYAASLGCRQD